MPLPLIHVYDLWTTHADNYLHCIVYSIFILCILSPGRLIKKVGRDVVDKDFIYNYSASFNYLWDLFYYVQDSNA